MLDAAAALEAVIPAPTARITVDMSALAASKSIFVSAATSTAAGNRTIRAYQWTLVSGQPGASFSGSTTAASATVVLSDDTAPVEIALRVTDSSGASGTTTQILVAAPVAPAGGGGGGSLSAGWLAGLLLACAWLWRLRHMPRNLRP
jgi:serine protease